LIDWRPAAGDQEGIEELLAEWRQNDRSILDCHTGDALATSFGQTVTRFLFRRWTMIGICVHA
jgi:hypothetical protein